MFLSDKWKGNENCSSAGGKIVQSEEIKLVTNKAVYFPGEKISLTLENGGKRAVYLEPCKFLNVFEKKIGEQWVLEDGDEETSYYFKDDFERQQGNARCEEIVLPRTGSGTYRMVVMAFYGCKSPNRYSCESSQRFHSNEFQVVPRAIPAELPSA